MANFLRNRFKINEKFFVAAAAADDEDEYLTENSSQLIQLFLISPKLHQRGKV